MEKTKISNLKLSDIEKALLTKLYNPNPIEAIVEFLGCNFTSAYRLMGLWKYKKWVITTQNGRKTLYKLNEKELEP